ncbi:beta-1,3-galactosyltransferase 5-like [Paramuricea clavata]|uniref:Hexosyltransferase n=1 Tax=Paramuricea clavata TaxID=317549 RepID=A0A7D9EZE1_PARCT|nr:beta-1,3-galactosyltransferase 5-like [Paramuricea clavata]
MLIYNPCRGRSSRTFIILFVFLQLLFVLAVFALYTSDTVSIISVAKRIQNDNVNKAVGGRNILTSPSPNVPATTHATSPRTSTPSPTKKPSIDMVNDYQPYVDFKLKYPEIQPKMADSKDFFLVVLVNSGAKGDEYRRRRAKIRETWASKNTCEYANTMNINIKVKDLYKWILVFVLGKAGGEEDKRNTEEAKRHNDMIIGDIGDNYLNNILKFYMGQLWASLLGAKYTLKTDDDVYVRIPKVIEYLVSEKLPSHFYGGGTYRGSVVMRFPDLLGGLVNYVHIRKPFHTDDAYIGVAMRDLKVKVVHILSFVIENNMSARINTKDDCYILKVLAYGHSVSAGAMEHVHKKLEDLCQANTTLKTLKCPA